MPSPYFSQLARLGKALAKESGGKLEHGRCMVVRARIHGVNESHVVDVIGKMGEKIGNPGPAFAVLLEGKGGGQTFTACREKTSFGIRVGQGLAVVFVEDRFVIEGVHLGRSASHVQPDDAFGFGREMSGAEGQRVVLGKGALGGKDSGGSSRLGQKLSS